MYRRWRSTKYISKARCRTDWVVIFLKCHLFCCNGNVQCLDNRNNLMRHFKHLDVVCPEFLTYMSNVRAQHIVLSGFGRHHMREAIDKAKYSALHAEYVQCICFESNCIDQFEAILENGRELPKTTQNLCISMRTPYRKKIPAPRLNPKKRGASEVLVL